MDPIGHGDGLALEGCSAVGVETRGKATMVPEINLAPAILNRKCQSPYPIFTKTSTNISTDRNSVTPQFGISRLATKAPRHHNRYLR